MYPEIPNFNSRHRARASALLLEMGIACHRMGFQQLCIAIPQYAENINISLSKELYPAIAEHMQLSDWRSVEHTIRESIRQAWDHRDLEVWEKYFPRAAKCPSNKVFLAVMAEYL